MVSISSFHELLHAKSLGFYNCFELTTAFLYHVKEQKVYHLFSTFVGEERVTYESEAGAKKEFLTPRRLSVAKDISLGIQRSVISLEQAEVCYQNLLSAVDKGSVNIDDGELVIGKLEAVPKSWISMDSTVELKLNRVLKNNFKNGSYMLEFFDVEKPVQQLLSAKELQKACELLYEYVPMDLFTISDRVGNFIFQFPSLNTYITYQPDEAEERLTYQVSLDKRLVGQGRYRLMSEIMSEDALLGFGVQDIEPPGQEIVLEVGDASKMCRTTLMDYKSGLILSRQETTFVRVFHHRMHMGSQFGKEREIYDADGNIVAAIDITSGQTFTTGLAKDNQRDAWMEKRRYRLRMEEVRRRREFLRYGTAPSEGREQALEDLRELMNRGDGHRVYLWDPYLSAQDLLDTWYYTKTYGLELKAITSRADCDKGSDGAAGQKNMQDWMREQARILEQGSNQYGINLEFRCQWKGHGFEFHDRFLMIVDAKETPQVWSLGASVNSIGSKHHIVQKVLHPQMIVDAFEELWEMLSDEECIIWKTGN